MSTPLAQFHDLVLFDLDGTVYRGSSPIPGADRVMKQLRDWRIARRYVTNNASKTPEAVAAHLTNLGLPASAEEVCTSAQAGARLLTKQIPAGSVVLVLGTQALVSEVESVGFTPVRPGHGAEPAAVIQGLNQDMTWWDMAEACLAITSGAVWVTCNLDPTLPSDRGELPGNGSIVAALATATGREPLVAGKPQAPLLEQAIASAGAQRPIMVGDRLDTDMGAACSLGIPGLFVLSGAQSESDLQLAPTGQRPTYMGADLTALLQSPEEVEV